MKKLLCFIGILMLLTTGFAQVNNHYFMPGERIPDIPLSRILNYKDSAAKLSDFAGKLIIIDFWSTRCSPCVGEFPLMDSIQKKLSDKVQLLMITPEPRSKVEPFLKNWEKKHNTKFSIPIIYGEWALMGLFPHSGVPCKVWIAPYGQFITITYDEKLFDYNFIKERAIDFKDHMALLRKDLDPSAYELRKPKDTLIKLLNKNSFSIEGWDL